MVCEKGDVVRWVRFVNETFGPSPTHADPGNEGSVPNNFSTHPRHLFSPKAYTFPSQVHT